MIKNMPATSSKQKGHLVHTLLVGNCDVKFLQTSSHILFSGLPTDSSTHGHEVNIVCSQPLVILLVQSSKASEGVKR